MSHAALSACFNCCILDWGESNGLDAFELARLHSLTVHSKVAQRGERLHHAGCARKNLYVVKSGCFKSSSGNDSGLEQITTFLLPGDWIGLDGIGSNPAGSNVLAVALSSVCSIPLRHFEELCLQIPALQRAFHRLLSNEINRDHGLMLVLGGMHAQERVAFFLLDLAARFEAKGYSKNYFKLPMTNKDIGNHLAIRNETLSRVLTKFIKDGLIAIDGKDVEIRDLERLKRGLES